MGKKLFLSTLAIIVLTLGLSMLSVNLAFKYQFNNYLTRTTEAVLQQLPQRLSSAYKAHGWDNVVLESIAESLPLGTKVDLRQPDNSQSIYILMNSMDIMHSQMKSMGMDPNTMQGMPYAVQGWNSENVAISNGNKTIAIAIITYPTSARILNPEDVSFMTTIFYLLIGAAGLSLLLGILLSYLTSKHLVSPLRQLTQAADRIGQGHLEERVFVNTKDEVGQLAHAFNVMSDNLSKQEKLRKQFIADIAHEIRTPLTSIRSLVEAFEDGVLPADSENLSSLNEEIDRLVDLASDLKDLNIAEMGALKIKQLPVDMNHVVDRVIHNLYPLSQEKNLNLDWMPALNPVTVVGDQHLLTRLVYNLVHNAYKYTESGGQIIVSLEEVSDSVALIVKDSGIGIHEDDLPFIFERFYRADKSRTRKTGGSGIGLALVRQIVMLHGGKIAVESKLGQGTTFTVVFPKGSGIATHPYSNSQQAFL